MPVGSRYKLDEVLEAVKYYYEKTQRRITFEYNFNRFNLNVVIRGSS